MEGELGHRRYPNDSIDTRLYPKGGVLRHIDPDADHVAVYHGEHRAAAGRVARDQAADIDVSLRHDAIERGDHLLIDFLLVCILQLGLHRCGVVLRRLRRMLLSLKSISIGVALLPRHPALIDEYRVASPGGLGKRAVGCILAGRGLGLLETVLQLSNLVIDFRGGDLGEELPGLDVIADVDIALQHIAVGARVDVRLLEGERRPGQ